jgi:inhibitor of cysteine peptidase
MQKIELSEIDQGRTLEIDNSDLIFIRLKENPSTGYRWQLHSFDEGIIKFKGSDYSMNSRNKFGGEGIATFTFEAKSPGTAIIQLRLERDWEKNNPIKSFEATLRVK